MKLISLLLLTIHCTVAHSALDKSPKAPEESVIYRVVSGVQTNK
jgi:hypothetical protein